jgi:hypothetical protein
MFSTFHKGKPKQNSKKVQLPNAIISNEFDPFASEDSMLPDEQSAKKQSKQEGSLGDKMTDME